MTNTDANQVAMLVVDPADLHQAEILRTAPKELVEGEVRLGVDAFALTSNNITYATGGAFLGYLDFYPTPKGSVIPAMSYMTVLESAHPDVAVGSRFFGFAPMASEFVIAAQVRAAGIRDVGPHRADHAASYTDYASTDLEAAYVPEHEEPVMLLRGLFMTSFLLADQIESSGVLPDGWSDAALIVSSASSKTSIALAFVASVADAKPAIIGVTSERNRAFVEALGCYSSVVTYDELAAPDATGEALFGDATSVAYADMAGNVDVTSRIHALTGDRMVHSAVVGGTHWDHEAAGDGQPPAAWSGPTPEFFFAPTQVAVRTKEWGPDGLAAAIGKKWLMYVEFARTWLDIQHATTDDEVLAAFAAVRDGAAPPSAGMILSL